ncbi:uncharacterized protein LOC118321667 [Morone saxatilis]|uniref:uncharacterized protein LOC118321667 n=1 Tax=Morone saxatilis TaxID=34816 RepID=UPI0015E21EC8|nr:uncharacterized protein LOC118321667 [Morone saxatilis]
MKADEEPPTHFPQCPAGLVKGRRNVEVKSKESSNERVELTVGVKTSKPKMSIELSSCFCEDSGACVCKNGLFDSPSSLCLSPGTAAAQTQMQSTKPKARTLVACRQLIDGNETAASLRDQSPLSLVTFKGTVSSATNPNRNPSVHASITGQSSVSAVQQDKDLRSSGNVTREENRGQYYSELCLQIEQRKQQTERERRRNTVDELKHHETMQQSIWGMPGSGAPNHHRGTTKRTRSLLSAGILPQEQIRDKGFSGTPFHCL